MFFNFCFAKNALINFFDSCRTFLIDYSVTQFSVSLFGLFQKFQNVIINFFCILRGVIVKVICGFELGINNPKSFSYAIQQIWIPPIFFDCIVG